MDFSLLPSQQLEVLKILKASQIPMAKALVWEITERVIDGMPINGNVAFSRLVFPNNMHQDFFFCFIPSSCDVSSSEGDNWKYRFLFSPGGQKKRYEEKDNSDWSSFAYYLNRWLEILNEEVKAMELLVSSPVPLTNIKASTSKDGVTRGELLDLAS
jgi:hypothetical protein